MNAVQERALGVSTAVAAVTIWAVFLVNTRFAISNNFSVEEVMTLRLVTASVVTLPFMIKLGVVLRGQSFVSTMMIALMPSAVAPYIISSGLFYASASDSGALAPGTLPFWAALLGKRYIINAIRSQANKGGSTKNTKYFVSRLFELRRAY